MRRRRSARKAASAAATTPASPPRSPPSWWRPFHSHHFNFRLDLDIDGQSNTFLLGKLEERPAPGPRRSIWTLGERAVTSESEGQLDDDHSQWKIVNGARRNALGEQVGYIVESHSYVEPLLHKADYRRAGFIGHPLWVTAFDPDERYAAGDTPNQNPATPGLPQYVRNNESAGPARPRPLADDRPPPRDAGRGLAGAVAPSHGVRAQARQLLRPQPGGRPASRAVRGEALRAPEATRPPRAARRGRRRRRTTP